MRVLQLNIWARGGPYKTRAGMLRREIGMLAPDVMALQECDGTDDGDNQAAELFGPLGYEVRFEARPGKNRGDPGIAIVARHPMGELQVKELGHDGVAIAAQVSIDDRQLWFCSAVPLGWWPNQEGQREDECVVLDEWLTDLAQGDEWPPILAGDFDATPDAASIRFLTGLQSLQGRSTHWVDTFAVGGDGSPGHTWSSDNPYVAPFAAATFAEPRHHRRIDYVFVGSPFKWKPRIVVRSAAVVLTERGDAAPSDHYGVMADLDLGGVLIGDGEGPEGWALSERVLWPEEG
jgi:endonuclease/exonuclease/phosphatase family metal-dependent hydrolase